jgi:hypothetical protein
MEALTSRYAPHPYAQCHDWQPADACSCSVEASIIISERDRIILPEIQQREALCKSEN